MFGGKKLKNILEFPFPESFRYNNFYFKNQLFKYVSSVIQVEPMHRVRSSRFNAVLLMLWKSLEKFVILPIFQDHPDLAKEEKKMICALMDVKKFSSEASIHAAQNERLPLRIIVQVLFFEHLKISGVMPTTTDDISMCQASMDEDWEGRIADHHNILNHQMQNLSIKADEYQNGEGKKIVKTRSTRIFDKLWIDKGQRETGKSSETSRSSQSTPSFVKRGEAKTTGSSRNTKLYIS